VVQFLEERPLDLADFPAAVFDWLYLFQNKVCCNYPTADATTAFGLANILFLNNNFGYDQTPISWKMSGR